MSAFSTECVQAFLNTYKSKKYINTVFTSISLIMIEIELSFYMLKAILISLEIFWGFVLLGTHFLLVLVFFSLH